MKKTKDNLIKLLRITPKKFKVVLMPHFCIDNFVQYRKSYKSFSSDIGKVVKRGGGSILMNQVLRRGGKAANVADGLSRLGLKPSLMVSTNEDGYEFMRTGFNGGVDLSHVKRKGELAFTTAIELQEGNVMINHPGSLTHFGPKMLDSKDKKAIKNADLVYISDWSPNKEGTELAKKVFSIAGQSTKTFFDPGDPHTKVNQKKEVTKLRKEIINTGLVDMFCLSESEVRKYGESTSIKKAVSNLSGAKKIAIHTSKFSLEHTNPGKQEKIPSFKVKPLRFTGAGDSWNSGYIYGELMGFPQEEKLLLANAVAAFYISSSDARHPNRKELINFIKKTPLQK